ncbi:trypsin-like serine peptidase [Bdellovibrio sp. HCB209]|uniref:trypsin-like serine peptidase n=1 Tax=Bdellovibrio sp. HCB209 TaxID=3394354 RepID=UPI0039B6B21E
MKNHVFSLVLALVLVACSEAPQNKISLQEREHQGVVYGDDSMESTQGMTSISDDKRFQINVQANAAMIYHHNLIEQADGTFGIPDKTVKSTFKTCPEFRYTESKNPALCSAALVAPNLVLTAAHCMTLAKDTCADAAFVFGFNDEHQPINKSDVYSCKKIRALSFFEKGNLMDYALVELDRDVPGIQPVKIKTTPLSLKDSIYTIGYPLGTTKKYSDGYIRSFDRVLAVSNLDEYAGNSGGPVFDKNTHELVGIVNSGEVDLEETARGCQMPKVCKDEECMGENILMMNVISESLKEKGEALASPL